MRNIIGIWAHNIYRSVGIRADIFHCLISKSYISFTDDLQFLTGKNTKIHLVSAVLLWVKFAGINLPAMQRKKKLQPVSVHPYVDWKTNFTKKLLAPLHIIANLTLLFSVLWALWLNVSTSMGIFFNFLTLTSNGLHMFQSRKLSFVFYWCSSGHILKIIKLMPCVRD